MLRSKILLALVFVLLLVLTPSVLAASPAEEFVISPAPETMPSLAVEAREPMPSGLTQTDLDGTHFVAGDPGGSDPTSFIVQDFSSHSGDQGWTVWLMAVLLALSSLGAWMVRQAYRE